jgi:hypothetical protein
MMWSVVMRTIRVKRLLDQAGVGTSKWPRRSPAARLTSTPGKGKAQRIPRPAAWILAMGLSVFLLRCTAVRYGPFNSRSGDLLDGIAPTGVAVPAGALAG